MSFVTVLIQGSYQGPVVQSIVNATKLLIENSLPVSLTVLTKSIVVKFYAEKM